MPSWCLCFMLVWMCVTAASSCVSQEEHDKLLEKVERMTQDYDRILKKSESRRFVLDGEFDYEKEVLRLHNKVEALENDRGSTYVRWGRTTCETNSTAVYRGYCGSNWYQDTGGPANYICLPEDPTWAKYKDGHQDSISTRIYGTEYENNSPGIFNPFSTSMDDEDVPCVVCRSPRPTSIMIPARTACYAGWHMEYTGYLMTMQRDYPASSEYICVDGNPEAIPHGSVKQLGNLLYVVEATCGSLPCLPYVEGRELACVVCSK